MWSPGLWWSYSTESPPCLPNCLWVWGEVNYKGGAGVNEKNLQDTLNMTETEQVVSCWALTRARQQSPGPAKELCRKLTSISWPRCRQHPGGGPGPTVAVDGAAPSEIGCIRSHQGCECGRVFPDIEDKMSLEFHMDPSFLYIGGWLSKRGASLKCYNDLNLGSNSFL